jgi:uncharacterized protein (DUF488 family)
MEIYTIGCNERTAEEFFETLKRSGIKKVIDVRLRNDSHLIGFTRMTHIAYLLKQICGAKYLHLSVLAPTADIFDTYKRAKGKKNKEKAWKKYEKSFIPLLEWREVEKQIDKHLFDTPTVLLCSEPTADQCHRRLVAEYLQKKWGNVKVFHL